MKTFRDYIRTREHAEDSTENDNNDGDREATRQKLVQIAKTACHKHPKTMITLLDRVAEQDTEIRSALEELKRNMKGFNLGDDQGLGDIGQTRDEVTPSSADSHGGSDGEESMG